MTGGRSWPLLLSLGVHAAIAGALLLDRAAEEPPRPLEQGVTLVWGEDTPGPSDAADAAAAAPPAPVSVPAPPGPPPLAALPALQGVPAPPEPPPAAQPAPPAMPALAALPDRKSVV